MAGLLDSFKENAWKVRDYLFPSPPNGMTLWDYAQMRANDPLQPNLSSKMMQQDLVNKGLNLAGFAPVGIVSPKVAQGLNTLRKLPEDELFKAAVANTPGAQIADEGLLMRIQRNQSPNQAMQPSVRGGVFYLPEGSKSAKHYTGTNANFYGGTDRIKGETLLSNPLFVKGATGGKAPEMAFDMVRGKGSYQAMRDDALKAYKHPGNPWDREARVAYVEEFLSKYAPEMQGMGENVVRNSPKGNQLAYALQEAAAGSAVRNAGHDSVLGYSKGKSGPFLSELFDVREKTYPDKFGGYNIWEMFNK
jgi:hypothetical protein